MSGQAWHWVDPAVGPTRAADVLAANGRLAVFWNYEHLADDALDDAVEVAYETFAPELEGSGIGRRASRRHDAETAGHVATIESCGRFAPCAVDRFPWTWSLSATRSWPSCGPTAAYALLPETRRRALIHRLADVVGSTGEVISLACEAVCVVADKAP